MKKTLNNLALLSFERKARKMGAKVVDCTKDYFGFDLPIEPGQSIILWSQENGFQETGCICWSQLSDVIIFSDKYENDHVFHFGIYSPKSNSITVFRTYDQIHSNKDLIVYDLKFFVDEYLSSENDKYDNISYYMSYITSLNGRSCCG